MTSRSYRQKDLKHLWGKSAARCSFSECRTKLIEEATTLDESVTLGRIAHIVAHSDSGPRGDPTYPPANRNKYPNLILLCPIHHDVVDGQESTYTIEDLRRMKETHEEWVSINLAEHVTDVGFAELEIVSKAIATNASPPSDDYLAPIIEEKIHRNQLTHRVSHLIKMGLAQESTVSSFVQDMAELDSAFPERLTTGFKERYLELSSDGASGDELFEQLMVFSARESNDFLVMAAGLAILSYLFHLCEVFE